MAVDPFGNTRVAGTSGVQSPFGFAGQHGYQTDADSGLMRVGYRYYDSSTGRFISRDPIQDGYNWYTYCENDPVNWVDPYGLDVQVVGGSVIISDIGMLVDTDGNQDDDVQSPYDPNHQNHTRVADPLDAKQIPYVVIYDPTNRANHRGGNYGVKPGDYGVVIRINAQGSSKTVGVIVGDTGPNFGDEGSINLHRQLGSEPRDANGRWGINIPKGQVKVILFPGSGNGTRGPFTNSGIQKRAMALYESWALSQLWGK